MSWAESIISAILCFSDPPCILDLTNESVLVGQGATFTDTILNADDVIWRHNDQNVYNSQQYKLKHEGQQYEMVINSCQLSDAGQVTITAKNCAGSTSKKAELIVQGNYLTIYYRSRIYQIVIILI